jgi:hypothetical protein
MGGANIIVVLPTCSAVNSIAYTLCLTIGIIFPKISKFGRSKQTIYLIKCFAYTGIAANGYEIS